MTTEEPSAPSVPADPVQIDLPQDRRAPADARRAAREALIRWRLPELVDTVVLAVSELVTNAVRHGRPRVSLELRRQPRQVGVAVHDGDPTAPPAIRGESEPDAEHGRGLDIVQALAAEVDVEQVDGDGKIVRAAFDVPPAHRPPAQDA